MSIERDDILCQIELQTAHFQSIFNAFFIFITGVILWVSFIIYRDFGGMYVYDFFAVISALSLILISIHLKILPTKFPYFARGYVTQEGIEFHHWLIPTQKILFSNIAEITIHETTSDTFINTQTKTIFLVLKHGSKASRLLRPKANDKGVFLDFDFEGIDMYRDEIQAGEICIVPNVINFQTVENVLRREKILN